MAIWGAVALGGCFDTESITDHRSRSLNAVKPANIKSEIWLAVIPYEEEECPVVEGWTPVRRSPPTLARFCEYRSGPSSPPFPVQSFERADKIRGRVMAQSSSSPTTALEAAMGIPLGLLFKHQADIPPAPAVVYNTPPTRLAIVDSMANNATTSASMHALGMDDFARAIGCTAAGCAFEISHHLALPRQSGSREYPKAGGFYGTRWDLARAIVEAVDMTPSTQELVINLSVGWAPSADDVLPANHLAMVRGTDSSVAADSRAVYAALVHAYCRGALVFAAAGNDDSGRRAQSGALLPGAWATVLLNGPVPCGTAGATLPGSEPMLYAVGGIDAEDGHLENARLSSTPTLVAPASGSAVGTSAVFTGTSVSTIVASSAAATVWSIRPNLTRASVVSTLRTTGRTMAFDADICPTPPCGRAQAISVCRAQQSACRAAGTCGPVDCTSVIPRPFPRPIEMFVNGSGLLGGASHLLHASDPSQVCGFDTYSLQGTAAPTRCSRSGRAAIEHLDLAPQPHRGGCPACGGGGGGIGLLPGPMQMWFLINVSTEVPTDLHNPYIVLHAADGRPFARYALPTPLTSAQSVGFTIMVHNSGQADSLWLEYETVTSNAGRLFHAEPLLTP